MKLPSLFVIAAALAASTASAERLPNVVVLFADDQGYSDVGVFGAEGFATPNLDRMAAEGRKFTDFYVAQPVCGASRAALLTGCYPNRIGISGAPGPGSRIGISADEVTLAELVKQRGYATAMFGKWHLGDAPQFLPTRHGFDEYFGLPYSNDMWPFHPTAPKDRYPPLPLIEGEEVIATNPDQSQLTRQYTERAVQFIEKQKDTPFFLYVAYAMPHVPLFASEEFVGTTERGLYGDVIAEIDWSAGEILKKIDSLGLGEDTLVVYTSDNGPWLSYGEHGGTAKPLREGKGTTWEGGVREPCLMRWTGTIPAGTTCSEPAMTIDILPTVAAMTGAELPEHKIDGKNILPLMTGGSDAESPHQVLYFYYKNNDLEALRSGDWKLHLPHSYRSLKPGMPVATGGTPHPYIQRQTGTELYNLADDLGETTDVAADHPEVIERLLALAEQARADLGDRLTKRPPGGDVRPAGRLP